MNRIYQGRAICCDLYSESDDSWESLDNWEQIIWDHHELFQDAVNYYVMALLALASDPKNPISSIKDRLAKTDSSGTPSSDQVWLLFRRKGATRQGMRDSVGKYICPTIKNPTPEDCYKEILDGNNTKPETLDAALKFLLDKCKGDGAIKQNYKNYFPHFFLIKNEANLPSEHLRKAYAQLKLTLTLHGLIKGKLQEFGALDLANASRRASFQEAKEGAARKKLMKLLSNPELYSSQLDTKPKDHLLAWLYLNPKISIKILGRKIKLTAPYSQSDKINSAKQANIEEIDVYGFRFGADSKPKNIDLNEYKSSIIGELADAASKALKIPISDKLVRNLF